MIHIIIIRSEVYPIMGNHDYYPINDLPGEENEIYRKTADLWDNWLREEDAKATFKKGDFKNSNILFHLSHLEILQNIQYVLIGSYYTLVSEGQQKLRIVALNTNLYLKHNTVTSGDDPANQFQWFDDVMAAARQNNESVREQFLVLLI